MNDVNMALLDKIESLAFEKGVLEAYLADEKEKVSELKEKIDELKKQNADMARVAAPEVLDTFLHGKAWNCANGGMYSFKCSRCAHEREDLGNPFDYCPGCGRKMAPPPDQQDEENEEEQ